MKNIIYLLVVVLISLLVSTIVVSAVEVTTVSNSVELIDYKLAAGNYRIGEKAVSRLELKSVEETKKEYWLGYSIKAPSGNWYDLPVKSITLKPKEQVEVKQAWEIPLDITSGQFDLVLALWNKPPSDNAQRLIDIRDTRKLEIAQKDSSLYQFNGLELKAAEHSLGRGRFSPANVTRSGEYLVLRSPENSFNGAEVRTRERFGYGSYQVKLKSEQAPGSFTAFFLYEDIVGGNDELDIEIYNDESNKVNLVTWRDGEKTNLKEKNLDLDPTADFHTYRIDYFPERVAFYAAGELLAEFTSDLPTKEMKLMVNHWWPTWLEGEQKQPESKAYIKEIKVDPREK